jgi:hypothetical protein
VLRESLGGRREASDFLLPNDTLSECLPDPAMAWLQARGTELRLRTPVRAVAPAWPGEQGWRVDLRDGTLTASTVILACGLASTRRLLAPLTGREAIAQVVTALDAHDFEPIATIWTAWPREVWRPLPSPLMFHWPGHQPRLADWLFDRGEHRNHRIGAIVISVASDADAEFTISDALKRASEICRAQGLPAPSHAQAVVDRRATFVCAPGRPIPDQNTHGILPGLWLAGDYTEAALPATIESAVRSGLFAGSRAARWLDAQSQASASA